MSAALPSSAAVSFSPIAGLAGCGSVSSCVAALTPPLPSAVLSFSRDYPMAVSAVAVLLALTALAWLLQDAREEVTRALWGRRDRQRTVSRAEAAPPVASEASLAPAAEPHNATQLEAHTDATSNNSGDSDWRVQQQRSSSPSFHSQPQQPHSVTPHSASHNRHRNAQEADRDRDRDRSDREWRGAYDRHDRPDRDRDRDRDKADRDREQPRRRSRYEDEDDSYGHSYYRADRDREERERLGSSASSREPYREKDVRRRPRDRDGHSSAYYNNGDGRPSLSPTQPAHPSLSLPSPGHRHHQSFSSLHNHVPPSPSRASLYGAESSTSVYETSMSSLPSASMLSPAASFSQLSSPSHNSDAAQRPSPFTSSPSVVVIGEGDFLWTLARGCELVKYGHYGSPHVRWFQIEVLHGVCRLSWGERRGGGSGSSSGSGSAMGGAVAGGHTALNLTKSIKLDDILDVRPGKQTPVFKQSRNDKIATDEQCCFSIITQKRSLDLQARDRQQRDEWVNGLRQTLSDRQLGNQQQKLIVAAMAVQQQQQQTQYARPHSS